MARASTGCLKGISGLLSEAASAGVAGDGVFAASRSAGEAAQVLTGLPLVFQVIKRHMARGKGQKVPTKQTPAYADIPALQTQPDLSMRQKPHVYIVNKEAFIAKERQPGPLSMLTEEQKTLAETIKPPVPIEEGQEPPPDEFKSFKQLGLPISHRDAVSLVHQSMRNLVGQNVHLKPFLFNNIFQSAQVLAQYIADAYTAGFSWARIERFLLSCVDTDPNIRGIQIVAKGVMGLRIEKAQKKLFEWGDFSLKSYKEAIDHGDAAGLTRKGVIGVRVSIRYHDAAIKQIYFRKKTGFTAPLSRILSQPRQPLPYRSPTAWWSSAGPMQPVHNHSWQTFNNGYGLDGPLALSDYQARETEKVRTFKDINELIAWRQAKQALPSSDTAAVPQLSPHAQAFLDATAAKTAARLSADQSSSSVPQLEAGGEGAAAVAGTGIAAAGSSEAGATPKTVKPTVPHEVWKRVKGRWKLKRVKPLEYQAAKLGAVVLPKPPASARVKAVW